MELSFSMASVGYLTDESSGLASIMCRYVVSIIPLLNSACRGAGRIAIACIGDKLTCLLDANSGYQNCILTPCYRGVTNRNISK